MDSDSGANQATTSENESAKEILAPAEGPRENMISTAVKFLQNPKVMSSPLYQKKAFLEKKGLTQAEIEVAVQRAGVTETIQPQAGQSQYMVPAPVIPGAMQPQYVPIPPQSGWARARDLTMTTVVVASVSYAVYQIFQTYIRPYLLGKSASERRMERLEQEVKAIHESVQTSLAQVAASLAAIQMSLQEQKQQTLSSQGDLKGIAEVKSDIASLKGLMLSKNQFPAAPTPAPILPAWQRAAQTPTSTVTSAATTSPQGLPNSTDNTTPVSECQPDSKAQVEEQQESNMANSVTSAPCES